MWIGSGEYTAGVVLKCLSILRMGCVPTRNLVRMQSYFLLVGEKVMPYL